jgi:aspartyl-tRNA(Asn)/glutamyl-tRNA(Gln) amidotransferase subunit A
MNPLALPVLELAKLVTRGELSAREVTERALAAIDQAQDLNAFIHVSREAALKSASDVDQRRSRGETLGALAGVPIAIKDALVTRDAPTTCGSKILTRGGAANPGAADGFLSPYDATTVERLRRADAILIGKTNLDEFAMGSSTENSAYGPSKNPWDKSRTPGGSSGGSAAAVSAGLCSAALGSDTGGSIRQPASFCGVVGVKPSYGRVSRYGLVAFASSLDQVGPFARDVESAAAVLEAMAGADPHDSTCHPSPAGKYVEACQREPGKLRVGVPAEYFEPGLSADVEASIRAGLKHLEALGAEIRPIKLPHTRHGVATYYVLATAEASSNLARFDGVRFGLRKPGANLGELYGRTRDAGFGTEVKRRILLGTYVLSAGYYDAYYLKAQKVRTLLRRDFEQAFSEVDVIATPTAPTTSFRLGEHSQDPLALYLADVYTLPASLAGLAGISLPVQPAPATATQPELPVGLQLLAPAFAEERLFSLARAVERAVGPYRAPPGIA